MIEVTISVKELKKAIKAAASAAKDGFNHSLPVFRLSTAGPGIEECKMEYGDLILKAHPIDPNLNWGRGPNPEWFKCVDGKIVKKY
jgi:hypothetical protein